ncbi:MAG: hypothetical protein M1814_003925 [Vezdaea aestivalis]|nr:MAG: hypothetical protein M1814_003925 [Vezdaea aestivalis]
MASSSLFPDFPIPNVDLWAFLFERDDCEFPGTKVIYVDSVTNRSYTFSELQTVSAAFGAGLRALWDWKKSEVLAVYSPNSIDTAPVSFGCLWAGGIVTTINPLYTVSELAIQLKDSGATAIATQWHMIPAVLQAADLVDIPAHRIILLGDARDPTGSIEHFTSVSPKAGTRTISRINSSPDDLSYLVYSSGTTGLPKGVMLSHRNLCTNLLQLQASEGGKLSWQGGPAGKGDKIIATVPFFHIYAQKLIHGKGLTTILLQAVYYGFETIVMASFHLAKFCELVQKHRITYTYIIPPIILVLSKHPLVSNYDLSSLRMVNSAAAPLTAAIVDAFWKRLRIPVKQGYGLSETSPCTHAQLWDEWQSSIGAIGKLVPGMKAKILDPEGNLVPIGESGELVVSGPNVFMGYLNNASATKAAFTDDGFFKTGDIAHMNSRGDFYVSDRIKELIKFMGFSVAPAELEGLLLTNSAVKDVAVVGTYDERRASEVPRAYIVPSPGVKSDKATEQEIIAWLAPRVAHFKWLRGGIRFVDEIPKSSAGKILRRVLKMKAKAEEVSASTQSKAKL